MHSPDDTLSRSHQWSRSCYNMFPKCSQHLATVSGSVANILCQSTCCIFEDVLYWFMNGSNMVKHIDPEKVVCFSSQKSSAFWCWTHAREPRSSLCSSPSRQAMGMNDHSSWWNGKTWIVSWGIHHTTQITHGNLISTFAGKTWSYMITIYRFHCSLEVPRCC